MSNCLTSSDWSSIYQSSHWDLSQCQGVCGPFWVVLQNETFVQCAICLTSNKTCPSREPEPRLTRNRKCLTSKKKRIKALFPPHFDQHLYPNGVSWGLFVFWECLGLMNSFEIISRAFKWRVCVSRAFKKYVWIYIGSLHVMCSFEDRTLCERRTWVPIAHLFWHY